MKRFQIILACEATDGYDLNNVPRIAPLLASSNVTTMLGFRAAIVSVSEEQPGLPLEQTPASPLLTRTMALRQVANELDRVGFDELPEYLGEAPLGIRVCLSFSREGFVPAELSELLGQLARLDTAELAAMGADATIAFFDAFGNDPRAAFDVAVETAVGAPAVELEPEPEVLGPNETPDAWARQVAGVPDETEQPEAEEPPEAVDAVDAAAQRIIAGEPAEQGTNE
jgi:hypothetical protein